MSEAFVGDDGINGYENTCLLDEPKVIVNRRTKDPHLRGEGHIGTDQRRNIVAKSTHGSIQRTIVRREVIRGEEPTSFLLIHLNG